MSALTEADTIRILVSTDNHVGYNEEDSKRGDDSWKTFHEIMCLAKERDVDMVLLAGDLFHDTHPSHKSMTNVMRSLRMNVYGDKPCELEILSDASENFPGTFNHVNYEDPDINVAIPVFSIHGNHDDPTGMQPLSALDTLQISGLVNYYGLTPESDNISVKPVLLQKGRTKLALYGLSNVRDERLFRTFRDGKVTFFEPNRQKNDWFNILSVHQNRHAYTTTGYLPENFLPEFMDLVIWGHEHECLITPTYNSEMQFHVMQPGSSVATSLMTGETVTKHVAIVSVTGKEFKSEPIRLKTVRPFVMKDITLIDEPGMKALAKKGDNRTGITRHLSGIVEEMIEEAKTDWFSVNGTNEDDEERHPPLPLIRLRVDTTLPEGAGTFDLENPVRTSGRFDTRVANVKDVIQFHRKRAGATRKPKGGIEIPDTSAITFQSIDSIKVEKLVREYLTAQSLTILPQNSFGDAVYMFVDKDDKTAMQYFVKESLTKQINHLLEEGDVDEDDMMEAMGQYRSKLEQLFNEGLLQNPRGRRLIKKPNHWNSDNDGHWVDQPHAYEVSDYEGEEENDHDDEESLDSMPTRGTAANRRGNTRGGSRGAGSRGNARGKATGRGGRGGSSISTRQKKTPASSSRTTKTGRGKKKVVSDDDDDESDEDDDIIMVDLDEEEDDDDAEDGEEMLDAPATRSKTTRTSAASKAAPPQAKKSAARGTSSSMATGSRQTTLTFSQPTTQTRGVVTNEKKGPFQELSDDEISDDDDAFEPIPSTSKSTSRR